MRYRSRLRFDEALRDPGTVRVWETTHVFYSASNVFDSSRIHDSDQSMQSVGGVPSLVADCGDPDEMFGGQSQARVRLSFLRVVPPVCRPDEAA